MRRSPSGSAASPLSTVPTRVGTVRSTPQIPDISNTHASGSSMNQNLPVVAPNHDDRAKASNELCGLVARGWLVGQ